MPDDKNNNLNSEEAEQKIKKLELEIEELQRLRPWNHKRPWFFRRLFEKILPPYLPTVLAILAFWGACKSNVFETKSAALELKKDKLALDIGVFTQEKKELQEEIKEVEETKNAVNDLAKDYLRGLVKFNATRRNIPCIENGILIGEDGKPVLDNNGKPMTIKQLNSAIREFRKQVITSDNDRITADDTIRVFDSTFDETFR